MHVEVIEATEADRELVDNLAQLYAYDFSEIGGFDAGPDGRFNVAALGEWPGQERRCFLIRVAGHPAGFALVGGFSVVSGARDVTDMNEFFVMRKYRRQGVGRTVAHRLFDLFPGKWEVREVGPNVAAQAFWRAIIGEYTADNYHERHLETERGPRVMQSFVTRPSR